MQLLKLVYLAHGWHLGLYGEPLIWDRVEAWQYGPVIPELYRAMRAYGSQQVTQSLSSPNEPLDEFAANLISQVYDNYGELSGPALSRLTHVPGSPWAETYVAGSFGIEIPNDLIEDYYRQKVVENRSEVQA
jgi:uncharacterized phage-associated protein